jgi:molybdopterin synthase sulfur carrier subunit
MATVKLFGGLRNRGAAPQTEVSGTTVHEVLSTLCAGNDELRSAIFNGEELQPHVRVMIGGRDIELSQGLDTLVSETDQLAVFPPIAGGARDDNDVD